MRTTNKSGMFFAGQDASASDSTYQLFDPVSTQAASKTAARARHKPRPLQEARQKAVEGAVYGQIRAMRALGIIKISTDQIARSLSIPRPLVDAAVKGMQDRGVKVSK